jgi:hypothetical protein
LTDLHTYQVLNALLANTRFWKAKDGSVPGTMRIWAGKVQTMENPDDLKTEVMADIYPSLPLIQQIVMGLAERRVGLNELSSPSKMLGNRTAGITAISMLQQVNKRFTPAFDGMKMAAAEAVKQCLYRYQERLLAGDHAVAAHICRLLGDNDGNAVIGILKDENFDNNHKIELSASSASVNREADRQNAIMLVNVLSQYYQRMLELVGVASNPQVPQQVRDVASKIAVAASEVIERTIRTFDQIRDPSSFIIDMADNMEQMNVPENDINSLLQQLGGGNYPPMLEGGAVGMP